MKRRLRPSRFGGRIALTTVGIALGTAAVIYVYVIAIGGAGSGNGGVKDEIIAGGLIAAGLALLIGIYYASLAAGNVRRLQAAARKVADGAPIVHGELTIDFDRRLVTLAEEEIKVTYVEFEILGALARSPGRVLTRETLLEHVWGDSEYRDPRTVDVHIRHLREKIERDPKEPEFLFTVRGVGYRFVE